MINAVEMINWRAYDQHTVRFGPGITFIMGANGIGKTSILEAIAYGLTGEPSTVKERGKLLRDPNRPATVRLWFTAEGREYLVERSQSFKRAEKATLTRVGEKKALASSHAQATARIEKLMGVSADFLRRIIYMAEGDVFRFLDEPPGEAINDQLRQVLGLTQLDQFIRALELAEKELKGRIKTVQELMNDLEKLDVKAGHELERRLGEMDTRRRGLWSALQDAQNLSTRRQHEREDLSSSKSLLDQSVQALRPEDDLWQEIQQTPTLLLSRRLEEQAREAESSIQQHQIAQVRLMGEQTSYRRTLDLLLPQAVQTETLPCPVCGKPMTRDEREKIIADIEGNLHRADAEVQNLGALAVEAIRTHDRLVEQLDKLQPLRDILARIPFEEGGVDATVTDIGRVIESRMVGLQKEMAQLHDRISDLERQIADLEKENSHYVSIQDQLQRLGYASPDEARDALIGLETRALSIRAADRAAQETLTAQRNADMGEVYDQIANVWAAFSNEDNWGVELDGKGIPVLRQGERQFDLSQFSGGEKTALLIILHTIIAHYFSRSNFLMIDEPLEHLDPVNRRSLVRFLVSAYRRGNFQQAIVATFEESLVRKYMGEEGVNVIHL
jgi:DNA repair exonuclease SbcCD ATPase subunit